MAQNTDKALSLLLYSVCNLHGERGVGAPAVVEGSMAEKSKKYCIKIIFLSILIQKLLKLKRNWDSVNKSAPHFYMIRRLWSCVLTDTCFFTDVLLFVVAALVIPLVPPGCHHLHTVLTGQRLIGLTYRNKQPDMYMFYGIGL